MGRRDEPLGNCVFLPAEALTGMLPMDGFSRRRYSRAKEALADMREISRDRRQMRSLMSGNVVSEEFRERLMLAVTEVNGCRYCSYWHARAALAAGLGQDEVTSLLEGDLTESPPDELTALLHAQHWADGCPTRSRDPPAGRRRLRGDEDQAHRTGDADDPGGEPPGQHLGLPHLQVFRRAVGRPVGSPGRMNPSLVKRRSI